MTQLQVHTRQTVEKNQVVIRGTVGALPDFALAVELSVRGTQLVLEPRQVIHSTVGHVITVKYHLSMPFRQYDVCVSHPDGGLITGTLTHRVQSKYNLESGVRMMHMALEVLRNDNAYVHYVHPSGLIVVIEINTSYV